MVENDLTIALREAEAEIERNSSGEGQGTSAAIPSYSYPNQSGESQVDLLVSKANAMGDAEAAKTPQKDSQGTPWEPREELKDALPQPQPPPRKDAKGTLIGQETKEGGKAQISPEKYWSKEELDFFNALDNVSKEKVLSMYKKIQKVYDAKTHGLNSVAKEHKELKELGTELSSVFAPYEGFFKETGVSKIDYIKNLVRADAEATRDPVKFIIDLMIKNGLNLDHLAGGIDCFTNRASDPEYTRLSALEREYEGLRDKSIKDDAWRQAFIDESLSNAVESFKNEVKEDGTSKHPYFEDVRDQMADLCKLKDYEDLETLYNEAVWLNRDLRERIIGEEVNKARAINKAKNLKGLSMQNSPIVQGSNKDKSLHDYIREAEEVLANSKKV